MRSIDPGRSARLCSRVVAVACHCDGRVCRVYHEFVCCSRYLQTLGALSVARMAYRDKPAGQQGIVCPSRPDSGFVGDSSTLVATWPCAIAHVL